MNPVDRIAIFVDGDNLVGTCSVLGWFVDFIKLHKLLSDKKAVYNAFYYTSWGDDDRKKSFAIFLTNNGYTVKKRDEQKVMKAGKVVHVKADTDILMVMDILLTKDNWDTGILVTGDGDFVPVIKYLRDCGKKTVAISSKFEAASIDLVNEVDTFIDLAEIRSKVERSRND